MSKRTKRSLIIIGIIIAVVVLFLAKGWVSKDELLGMGETLLTGQSQSEASLPEAVFPQSEQPPQEQEPPQSETPSGGIDEGGSYNTRDEVALYLHTYGRLPKNYLTKSEAQELGWVSNKGNLDEVAPGMSIGGDRFSNREGGLPTASGRKWFECDINYEGGYRGAERILYSSDGLVFYTDDHYETFTQLY